MQGGGAQITSPQGELENDISKQVMKGIQMYMQRLNPDQQLNSDLLK